MSLIMSYQGGQLTGDDINFEDFKLSEALCDAEQLTFGSCIASKIKFTISNQTESLSRKDMTVVLNGTQLGIFRAYDDVPDANSSYRTVTAYDALYRIRNAQIAEWYRALFPTDESSMTLKAFRDSFFQHFGVEQEQISLVNDNLVLRRTIDPQTLYGHDVIEDLCEINGVFGHIDAEGVFRYVGLQNMQTSDIPASEVENFEYQNYTARAIGRVTVRGTEADMGATYGSGENEYFVTGNIFALGRSSTELEQIAQRLSTRIFGVSYIPFSADVDGMRNMSLGRRFNIEGGLSTLDNLLVLEHELVGILAPHSTISAKGREEWREEKSSVESDIRVVASQTNELTRTVEQTISKVETIEGDYVTNTEFLQNSTEVNLKLTEVDRELQKITEELDGDIKLYNLDYEPTLDNYPAWDFTENLKCAFPGDPGYFECDEGVTFIYDDDSYRKHVRDLAYDETTATSYRFVREGNQYFWKQVADSEFGVAMAKIASLEASTEEIRQDVEEQRLVIDDQGARLETAEGELSVQSREISAKVSVQDGDATTACSWNMTPERFAIQSNGADVLKVTEAGLEVSGQGKFQGQVTGNIVKTRELTVGTDTKAYSRVGNASFEAVTENGTRFEFRAGELSLVKFARIDWIPIVITNPDGSTETIWYAGGSVTDDSKKMSITDALFQIIQETIRVGNLRYTKEINLNANQSVGLAGPVKINTAYSPTVINTTEIGNDGRDTIVAGNQLKLKGLGIIQVIGGGHGSDIEVQGLSLKLTENTPLTLVDDTGSVTLTAAKLRRLLALVE